MIFFNRYTITTFFLLLSSVYSKNEICDDTRYVCPTGDTCCKLGNSTYGCCPMPSAVCCSDHEHCCPHNTVCKEGRCYSENKKSISGFNLKLALLVKENDNEKNIYKNISKHTCADKITECADDNTCCEIKPYGYGCCPLPNAVCCSDREHCCPQNTTCISGMCRKNNNKFISGFKLNIYSNNKELFNKHYKNALSNICEDKKTECPDDATCCLLNSGEYGCCPFQDAVCCNDRLHCCPFGFKCNLKEESCEDNRTGKKIPLVKKINGRNIAMEQNKDVENICPGNKYECPNHYSCCRQSNGSYNCCPSTQKCNPVTGKCVNKGFIRGVLKNKSVKAKKIYLKKAYNLKQGFNRCFGRNYCKQREICCRGYDGFSYCCPKSQGKCDPSGFGCYESGYEYDVETGKAVLKTEIGEFYSPIVNTTVALKKNLDDSTVCDDGTICEDNQTCCPYENEKEPLEYRCCPFKNGECCRNSCCASGYKCSSNGKCLKKY
uniref:Granulins (inferred by orthology to a human protein) n=1 Tax=Strongyloides venezuelensis TaxID=75913 RepID=A0A0K0G0N9_STRVS